ncbi:phage tail length tape measure family protein [Neisseria subflava]|nr:phage tail length tape measure family protein [Neisseria subflava]
MKRRMAENTIKAGLDVTEIEYGAKKAGVALRNIGKAAKEAGKESAAGAAAVAAGYDKAGKEAERLTKKQERATQSIINSVQREIAVREAGGRGTAAYYETLARQRGADVAKIREVTKSLKQQENQLKLNNISVGQYNNAMRMVPAQFTDIITQLAGGQNPLWSLCSKAVSSVIRSAASAICSRDWQRVSILQRWLLVAWLPDWGLSVRRITTDRRNRNGSLRL